MIGCWLYRNRGDRPALVDTCRSLPRLQVRECSTGIPASRRALGSVKPWYTNDVQMMYPNPSKYICRYSGSESRHPNSDDSARGHMAMALESTRDLRTNGEDRQICQKTQDTSDGTCYVLCILCECFNLRNSRHLSIWKESSSPSGALCPRAVRRKKRNLMTSWDPNFSQMVFSLFCRGCKMRNQGHIYNRSSALYLLSNSNLRYMSRLDGANVKTLLHVTFALI